MMKEDTIKILGARVHNLKNIDLEIPRRKLVVITGLSGSGKSSLAFDTIYAEGQRRYMETLSTYARQFVGTMERPDVDKITGLSPVVAIEQKTTNKNPRSTVGTVTEINDFLRLLYARASRAYSPVTGEEMVHYTDEQIAGLIMTGFTGRKIALMAPHRQRPQGALPRTVRVAGQKRGISMPVLTARSARFRPVCASTVTRYTPSTWWSTAWSSARRPATG